MLRPTLEKFVAASGSVNQADGIAMVAWACGTSASLGAVHNPGRDHHRPHEPSQLILTMDALRGEPSFYLPSY